MISIFFFLAVVAAAGKFDFANNKLRGVNLGGWFVLEPFISPSLFECFPQALTPVDEYHYTEALGKDEAKRRLEYHWDTWINETDIEQISNWGFNHVRIPIGYWAFELLPGDPYVQGQIKYMDRVISWCEKYGIYAMIDLHGAPGSQNGFDNSGLRDQIDWTNGKNIEITLNVLAALNELWGDHDHVSSIELLNEPLGTFMDMNQVKQFYIDGYTRFRNQHSNVITIHDAFQEDGYWNGVFTTPQFWNVLLDHHKYQVFSVPELNRTMEERVEETCKIGKGFISEDLWGFCGEWSAAMTDCTIWLNGLGKGARYDGTFSDDSVAIGTCDGIHDITKWSDQKKADTRRFVEAQMQAFDQKNGWVFWTYKTDNSIEWDARRLIENKMFPIPFDDYQYPNQCQF